MAPPNNCTYGRRPPSGRARTDRMAASSSAAPAGDAAGQSAGPAGTGRHGAAGKAARRRRRHAASWARPQAGRRAESARSSSVVPTRRGTGGAAGAPGQLGISWAGTKALMMAIESRGRPRARPLSLSGADSAGPALRPAVFGDGSTLPDPVRFPVLVIHGTASSTLGSFSDLRGANPALWSALGTALYRRHSTFEHGRCRKARSRMRCNWPLPCRPAPSSAWCRIRAAGGRPAAPVPGRLRRADRRLCVRVRRHRRRRPGRGRRGCWPSRRRPRGTAGATAQPGQAAARSGCRSSAMYAAPARRRARGWPAATSTFRPAS